MTLSSRPPRPVQLEIDGRPVEALQGQTILAAAGGNIPTLCYLETLTPVNVCRLCVVEVSGTRALVPACSREVEAGMAVLTDSARVRAARRMVLELLASSVDLSLAGPEVETLMARYGARPQRHGPPAPAHTAGERDSARAGHHHLAADGAAERVDQPEKLDNELYLRDYARCILCYKCVEACGADAQNTFAIAVAGRGFEARISTEFDVALPDSACVYCGNCVAVCPTGALMPMTEYRLRAQGAWDETRQHVTRTVCPYCGVGCNLDLHVQDNRIVKVTSPADHSVTHGNLCVKGRYGVDFVHADDDVASDS